MGFFGLLCSSTLSKQKNPWFLPEVLGGRQLLRVWLRFRLLGQWGGHGDKHGAKIGVFCWWFEMISYDLKWLQDIWSDLIIYFWGLVTYEEHLAVCLSLPKNAARSSSGSWLVWVSFFEFLGELSGTVINPLGGRNGPWWQRPRLGRWRAGPRPHPVKMKARKGLGGERDMDVLWCCFVGWKTEWKRTMFFRWKSKNISQKTCWVQVLFGDFDEHLDGYTWSKHLHTCKGVGFIRHLCARCCTASSGPFAHGQEEWTDAWADQGHEESHVPWRQPWKNSKIAFNVREKLLSWNPTCGKMTWSCVSLEPGEFESACRVGTGCRRTEEDWWLCQYHHRLRGIAQDVREASKPGAPELRGDEDRCFHEISWNFQHFEPINMFEKRMFFSSFIVSQVIKGWCPWQSSLQIIARMGVSPFLIPASWPQQVEADGGPPKQFVKAIGALEDYIEPLVVSSYHNFPNEIPIAYWGSCNFLAYLRCLFGFGAENNFWVGLLVSSSRNLQQLLLLQIEYFVGEAHPNV